MPKKPKPNKPTYLQPNYFYTQLQVSKTLRTSLEKIASISHKNKFFLIEPLGTHKKLCLQFEKEPQDFVIDDAHITIYDKCQFSNNPKKHTKNPNAGHDYFSPGHVTIHLINSKKNQKYSVRLYFDYKTNNGLNLYYYYKGQKWFTPPAEAQQKIKIYIDMLFDNIIELLKREVLIKQEELKECENNFNQYIKPFLDCNDFSTIDCNEYLSKLTPYIKVTEFMVNTLKFLQYESSLKHLFQISEVIKEMPRPNEIQSDSSDHHASPSVNNNANNKSRKSTPSFKPKPAHSKPTKNKAVKRPDSIISYLENLHKELQRKQKIFSEVVLSDLEVKEIEKMKHNVNDICNGHFLSNLFIQCIQEAKFNSVQYLTKLLSKHKPLNLEEEAIMGAAFEMVLNSEPESKSVKIFIFLIKDSIFFSALRSENYSHTFDNGEVIKKISLINRVLLLDERLFKIMLMHKTERGHQINVMPILHFATTHFLINKLIFIATQKKWNQNKANWQIFGIYTLAQMLKQLCQVFDRSKLEKTVYFIGYLIDNNFDFLIPNTIHAQDHTLDIIRYLLPSALSPMYLFVEILNLGLLEIAECIMKRIALPVTSNNIDRISYESSQGISSSTLLKISLLTFAIKAWYYACSKNSQSDTRHTIKKRRKIVSLIMENIKESILKNAVSVKETKEMISESMRYVSFLYCDIHHAICLFTELMIELEKLLCFVKTKVKDPLITKGYINQLEEFRSLNKKNFKDKWLLLLRSLALNCILAKIAKKIATDNQTELANSIKTMASSPFPASGKGFLLSKIWQETIKGKILHKTTNGYVIALLEDHIVGIRYQFSIIMLYDQFLSSPPKRIGKAAPELKHLRRECLFSVLIYIKEVIYIFNPFKQTNLNPPLENLDAYKALKKFKEKCLSAISSLEEDEKNEKTMRFFGIEENGKKVMSSQKKLQNAVNSFALNHYQKKLDQIINESLEEHQSNRKKTTASPRTR